MQNAIVHPTRKVSVCFPKTPESDMLLVNLDAEGICVSGGSTCSSGAGGSHVIQALRKVNDCTTIRFSFSKHNTREEIDQVLDVLKAIFVPGTQSSFN